MPKVRRATPQDLPAIARISHQTLLLGREGARVFPSKALWGELFVAPYLRRGCCSLVAEEGGEVVGYILGACSDGALLLDLLPRLPLLLLKLLLGRYGPVLPHLRYLFRLLLFRGPKAPKDRYPAHLHIAVSPKAQGHGVGRALLAAFLECLKDKGVAGVQLSTTRANQAARRLYRSLGFRLYAKRASPFWAPYHGHPVIHEVWVRPL
ncbi:MULTISPECIES: GNAT family N-acetyltransferase [Thermus]|jgi:ribosomal protein S18 acetylase RimI-like enzyme|uniref:Acetyltransferase n=1 Tax=Thermus brockianus TaxID=56956 RepID=A0A1J0LUM2_THEBO|nr:GNAT family N-acetyltransferase [Thermus brockianus]APD09810.1 acetyltransferase [Thermus brockianus]BDG16882.1 acetyltransferase [Thermus brockianus]